MTETSTPTDEARAIVGLIQTQAGLYQELEALSERQHAYVQANQTDAVITVLGQRQAVIDRISAVSADLAPFQAGWDRHIEGMPESVRSSVRASLSQVQASLRRISERDEQDKAVMEARRRTVGDQLSDLRRSDQAVQAYVGKSAKGPRFQDRSA
ncbi:MAG: flagellar export chaperone FlgN [Planctomycetota bacterium]